jgi:hypothetical protein
MMGRGNPICSLGTATRDQWWQVRKNWRDDDKAIAFRIAKLKLFRYP